MSIAALPLRNHFDVLSELVPLSGKVALDVGCGEGRFSRLMAGAGARVTGIEPGPQQIRRALAQPNVAGETYLEGSAESLQMATGSVDLVMFFNSLHHVPVAERPAVYAELGRVLKPGGRLYVFEHNPRNPLVRYVIARTPIDQNAILLDETEVRHGLLDAARYDLDTDYLMFMPPGMAFLRPVDRLLTWLPLGAQYVVVARKPA